jgi:hypothetical protein
MNSVGSVERIGNCTTQKLADSFVVIDGKEKKIMSFMMARNMSHDLVPKVKMTLKATRGIMTTTMDRLFMLHGLLSKRKLK